MLAINLFLRYWIKCYCINNNYSILTIYIVYLYFETFICFELEFVLLIIGSQNNV